MLTVFHGHKFCDEIDKMNIDNNIKEGFTQLANEFLQDLLELTEFDPNDEMNKDLKTEVEKA